MLVLGFAQLNAPVVLTDEKSKTELALFLKTSTQAEKLAGGAVDAVPLTAVAGDR